MNTNLLTEFYTPENILEIHRTNDAFSITKENYYFLTDELENDSSVIDLDIDKEMNITITLDNNICFCISHRLYVFYTPIQFLYLVKKLISINLRK